MRSRICSTHVLFNISVPYSPSLKRLIGLVSGYDSDPVKEKKKKKREGVLTFFPFHFVVFESCLSQAAHPTSAPAAVYSEDGT